MVQMHFVLPEQHKHCVPVAQLEQEPALGPVPVPPLVFVPVPVFVFVPVPAPVPVLVSVEVLPAARVSVPVSLPVLVPESLGTIVLVLLRRSGFPLGAASFLPDGQLASVDPARSTSSG
jgi:hypothetical protein